MLHHFDILTGNYTESKKNCIKGIPTVTVDTLTLSGQGPQKFIITVPDPQVGHDNTVALPLMNMPVGETLTLNLITHTPYELTFRVMPHSKNYKVYCLYVWDKDSNKQSFYAFDYKLLARTRIEWLLKEWVELDGITFRNSATRILKALGFSPDKG